MKNGLQYLLAFCLFSGLANNMVAQTPCYTTLRNQGIKYMKQGDFVEATGQFFGALKTCDDIPEKHDLYDLIEKAQQAERTRLGIIIQKEQNALLLADSAREIAINARQLESEARQLAEQNAQIAREQGRMAESLRISLLADMAREKGAASEALQLALLGLYLSENKPASMRAFGAAVRDSFTRNVLQTPASLDWMGNLLSSGKILAKNADQELYLVDVNTGSSTLLSAKKQDRLQLIASASGRYFLSWSGNEAAQIWDATGTALARLKGHTAPIRNAAFSANDSLIVTCGRDSTVRVWTLNGQLQSEHKKHNGNVYEVFFSSGGKYVFSRASDGTAFEWDLSENQVMPLGASHVYLYDLSIADVPTTTVSVAAASGIISVWASNGILKAEKNLKEGAILETIFCPGFMIISAITASGKAFVWNADKDILSPLVSQDPIKGAVWSPQGNYLLSWSTTQELLLWNAQGDLIRRLPGIAGGTSSAEFSGDGMHILVTGCSGAVRLIDLEGNVQMEWPVDKNRKAALLADGRHILINMGNQLSICPLPAWILSRSANVPDREAPFWAALIKKYNIQFFEELK